jgi:hypothetical protein
MAHMYSDAWITPPPTASEPSMTTDQLMDEVRTYVAGHVHARDTAQGVAQWWLPHLAVSVSEVQLALAALVATGELQSTVLPDGAVLYGRSKPAQGRER